jgi:RHS repeat-associated protein
MRYTGHQDDAEVGLIYFGARYYNPELGRWISPDPFTIHGLGGDLNPYAFVGGSPMGSVDPIGLCDDKGKEQQCQKSGGGGIFDVLGFAGLVATLGVAAAAFYGAVGAASTAVGVGVGAAGGVVGLAFSPGVMVNAGIGYGAYEGVKAFGGLLGTSPGAAPAGEVPGFAGPQGGYMIRNPWWDDMVTRHPYASGAALTVAGTVAVPACGPAPNNLQRLPENVALVHHRPPSDVRRRVTTHSGVQCSDTCR